MESPYADEINSNELVLSQIRRGTYLVEHFKLVPFLDGNQWCYLLGNNLQEGIAGFGDTALGAAEDFDKNYCTRKAP